MPERRQLHGDRVLYPFLQRELVETDLWLAQLVAARLVVALGIWFHPSTYQQLPVLLPHVVRDSSARKSRGEEEEWGSPNQEGLLRDDNSLIKNAIKSLRIESTRPGFHGASIGNGWVAAHIWQLRRDGLRATTRPETNSFLPNLVWLPTWLASMSDRPGSFVQEFLQAISASLYARLPVQPGRDQWAARAWDQFEVPSIPKSGIPHIEQLNFFEHSEIWLHRRVATIIDATRALRGIGPPTFRPRRYRVGVEELSPSVRSGLADSLSEYIGRRAE